MSSDNPEATQFRVLYRLFVFRLVDIELLSANALGDSNKLLGQIAALLIFISIGFSFLAGAMTSDRSAPPAKLLAGWNAEHMFLATALLIANTLPLLNWDSFFPDRRDVTILSPLPVKQRVVFLAKAAALVSIVGVLTATFCAFPVFCYSVALVPPSRFGILDVNAWLSVVRSFCAFAITIATACVLPISVVTIVQSVGSVVLPRDFWLSISGFLQIGLFAAAITMYFLASPILPDVAAAHEWYASYWLVGMFESARGPLPLDFAVVAHRGWTFAATLIFAAAVCYGWSYLTVTRRIVEQADVRPSRHAPLVSVPYGGPLETAIVRFSIHSFVRSKQHRVVVALFLGVAMAIVILAVKTPVAAELARSRISPVGLPGLIASTIAMICAVLGIRLVYALPLELRANWIFRTIPGPHPKAAKNAVRRALLLMSVLPVFGGTVAVGLWLWPMWGALSHLAVLGMLGVFLAELCLASFDKLPFTCSYLPGKSNFNMAFLGFAALLQTGVIQFCAWERGILNDPLTVTRLIAGIGAAWGLLRYLAWRRARSGEFAIQFEEQKTPEVETLGIYRDGVSIGQS